MKKGGAASPGGNAAAAPLVLQGMNGLCFRATVCMLALCCQAAEGADVVREARKVIRNAEYEENVNEAAKVRERLDAAEKSLTDALGGEERAARRAELYHTAALVECKLNDIENEKIYLGRAYDTVLYYNSAWNACRYFEQCDSVEASSEDEGRFKFRPAVRKSLLEYRAILLNGGRFYIGKRNYAEAFRFIDMYLSSAGYPALEGDFLSQTDTVYPRAAYWMTVTGYRIGAYGSVIRYAPAALRYARNRQHVQEYLCRSHLALKDTAAWVRELRLGVANFPDHTYFFTALQVFLNHKGEYEEASRLADRMIQYDPKNALFWYAKALACVHKKDYEGCVANCDVVLLMDSMNVEANYFKGLAYCNMAKASSDAMEKAELNSEDYRKHKAERTAYYGLAEKPLERVRRLSPDKASRWAPLLYQVYLNQNKGAEFDEMERVMRDMREEESE